MISPPFNGNVAKHVDDVVYLFWHVRQMPTEVTVNMPSKILKRIHTSNGDTALYSVDMISTGPGRAEKRNESYLIHSREAAGSLKDRRNEDLRSTWQVNVMIADLHDGKIACWVHVSCSPLKEQKVHLVQFDKQTGHGNLTFDPLKVAEALREIIPIRQT